LSPKGASRFREKGSSDASDSVVDCDGRWFDDCIELTTSYVNGRQMDVMFRKLVGLSLLALWLVLSGIALGESIGFITNPPDKGKSVEVTLAALGATIKTFHETQVTPSLHQSVQPTELYSSADQSVAFNRFRNEFGKELNFSKEHIPIYKLHHSFLI